MTKFFRNRMTAADALEKMQQLVIRDIKREYPAIDYFDETDLIQSKEKSNRDPAFRRHKCIIEEA
jgi:hypothetical protein